MPHYPQAIDDQYESDELADAIEDERDRASELSVMIRWQPRTGHSDHRVDVAIDSWSVAVLRVVELLHAGGRLPYPDGHVPTFPTRLSERPRP